MRGWWGDDGGSLDPVEGFGHLSQKSLLFRPDNSKEKAMSTLGTALERITFNPNQCGGHPCIRGMRVRVKDVLDMLAAGATEEEILRDYPYLEEADIRACLEYASAQVNHAVVVPAP